MAGVADEEAIDEQDKGHLNYQESKVFHTETFLCNVYDNPKRRFVTFEVYGLETQDTLHKGYEYSTFDQLFRFNAELMNPNRKEGRFHWVIERLSINTIGKDRKLQLMPDPSEEVPSLPIYETTRKIPTGRMDLKERQRLREQMDMLDIKRAENIQKKRVAMRERFLKHLFKLKELDEQRKKEVEEKIAEEKKQRFRTKDEQEALEAEAHARKDREAKMRRKAVEAKESRTEEQDEEEYRQLRARWRVLDADKAAEIREIRERREAEREVRKEADNVEKERQVSVQEKREVVWHVRSERVAKKDAARLKQTLERKAELQRQEKMRLERNQEYIKVLHSERQPIFREQLLRTKQRDLAREQEMEAVANYVEKRSIPKKVKKKGKNAKNGDASGKPEEKKATKLKGKTKEGKSDKSDTEPVEGAKPAGQSAKEATDRVLDSVEKKMRDEMAEEARRKKLMRNRQKKTTERDEGRQAAEETHMKEYREQWRKTESAKEQLADERRLVYRQKVEEASAAAERKASEWARLQRVRQDNIFRRETDRIAALCA